MVVGAGLLIHSFLRVLNVNLGFHPERAMTLRVDPTSNYDSKPKVNAYFINLLQRADEISGVSAAGITDALPYGTNRTWGAGEKGVQYDPANYPFAFIGIVSPGYFQAMGIPVIRGRSFQMDDPIPPQIEVKDGQYQHDAYAVINETMARNVFHGEDPIGRQTNGGATIIGVVGDTRHLSLEKDAGNEMYFSMIQTNDWSSANLVVRTTLPNSVLASQLKSALSPIAPDLAVGNMRTVQSLVDKAVSPRRFVVMLLAGFALFALILASLGIYAVVSYSVSQRRQENRHSHGARRVGAKRAWLSDAADAPPRRNRHGHWRRRERTAFQPAHQPALRRPSGRHRHLRRHARRHHPGRIGRRLLPGPPRQPHRPDDRPPQRIASRRLQAIDKTTQSSAEVRLRRVWPEVQWKARRLCWHRSRPTCAPCASGADRVCR